MTDQGKPSVCPVCGSEKWEIRLCVRCKKSTSLHLAGWCDTDDESSPRRYYQCYHPWHSSPVPAATTIAGFPLKVDPKMPPDQVELRGTKGRVVVTNVSAPHAVPAATTAYGMVTHPKWPDPTWDTGIQNSEDALMSTSLVPEGIPESRVNSPFSKRVSAPQAESVPAGKDAAGEWLENQIHSHRERFNGKQGMMVLQDCRFTCSLMTEFAASETAALRAERDKWRDLEEHEAKFSQALERENASLKRRIADLEGRKWLAP